MATAQTQPSPSDVVASAWCPGLGLGPGLDQPVDQPGGDAEAQELLEHPEFDARDLPGSSLDQLRAYFEDRTGLGLYRFAYYICGCRDLYPPLHLDICEFLSHWGQLELANGDMVERPPADRDEVTRNWRRLMLLMPRDSFKTSLATRANGLWRATLDPSLTFGIFNESEAKVKSWIGSIKQIIERSILYQVLWPEVLPPGISTADHDAGLSVPRTWKWGDTGIVLNRDTLNVSELTFEPFGIGGSHTGKHFTHVILDDIIGEKSGQSQAVMEDAIHFADHCRPLERPAENGCQLIACTRWSYSDVYSHILRKWQGEYQILQRSLLENPQTGEPDLVNGVSIFPTRIPTDKAKMMAETDGYTFSAQYQNLPKAGRETGFQPTWPRYGKVVIPESDDPTFIVDREHFDPTRMEASLALDDPAPNLVPLSWMSKAILLDPAPTKKGERSSEPRARNGIVAVGKDAWGRRFALEAVGLREDPVAVLDRIVEMSLRWRLDTVGIEEVNFSAIYAPLWSEIMRSRYPTVQLQFCPLKTKGRDKDTRIRSLAGPLAEGLWYFERANTGYLLQELLEYPYSESRDLIDALAYTDDVLSRPMTPTEQRHIRRYSYNSRRPEPGSTWTGY